MHLAFVFIAALFIDLGPSLQFVKLGSHFNLTSKVAEMASSFVASRNLISQVSVPSFKLLMKILNGPGLA
jgi:hypothetical protein